jgi:thioredoxin reductase (NADPH)
MNTSQVIVIGAGPGGLAAALQLKRYGITPIIFEQDRIGGLLWNANLVENYPGFPEGISGPKLVELFTDQAEIHDLQIKYERVSDLNYEGGKFHITTSRDDYHSNQVVIATGTKPRLLSNLHIPEMVRDRVYYEVYPLLEQAGKQIAIIGAGDAAFDYALNLSRNNELLILNHGEYISCLPLLWERAKGNPRIKYHSNTQVTTLTPTPDKKIAVECSTPTGKSSFQVEYLIVAIGRDPQLDFMPGNFQRKGIELENSGYLYYVGDVTNGLYRQTAIAVGDGILSAMKIYQYFQEND